MASIDSPIPLSEIESVLAWVDTFKLSRPNRKINRDFSDAVLLAEMLSVHYPKLVEMHNYPPRNSHSLKLNNWMTLNRKVLKKLKLNLCCNTMEQLANCAPGVIERVLVMVRDKIRRDEDANRSLKDAEQNMSSGGSYYEACGDEEHVLVVPIKTRVNGFLETLQQKVVSYDAHCTLKEELKDARDAAELLKQKVEHLDNLLKLKQERIDELQNQLERKQARRKEIEAVQSNPLLPNDSIPLSSAITENLPVILPVKTPSLKALDSKPKVDESRIPVPKDSFRIAPKPIITEVTSQLSSDTPAETSSTHAIVEPTVTDSKSASDLLTVPSRKHLSNIPSATSYKYINDVPKDINIVKSDILVKEIVSQKSEAYIDVDEFKDSEGVTVTIEDTIQNEIKDIGKPMEFAQDISYVN